MKRVFVLVILATGVAHAQSAETVLANVQQFYANAKHLTATFKQKVTLATFSTAKTSEGQLWILKPASIRVDYATTRRSLTVVTKSFMLDGTSMWTVDHDNKQITRAQLQSTAPPAALAFLTGRLPSQFAVAFNTSGKFGGANATVLELTPKQPNAEYKQLYFVVDPTSWQVNESIVIDSNGNTNDFSFFTPNFTAPVKPSWFQVNPTALPTYKLVQVAAPATQTPQP